MCKDDKNLETFIKNESERNKNRIIDKLKEPGKEEIHFGRYTTVDKLKRQCTHINPDNIDTLAIDEDKNCIFCGIKVSDRYIKSYFDLRDAKLLDDDFAKEINRLRYKEEILLQAESITGIENIIEKAINANNILAFVTDGITDDEKEYVKQYIEDLKKLDNINKFTESFSEIIELLKSGKSMEETLEILGLEMPKLKIKDDFLFDKIIVQTEKKLYAKVEELQPENIDKYNKGNRKVIRDAFLNKNTPDIIFPETSLLTQEQKDFINAGPDKNARMAIVGGQIIDNERMAFANEQKFATFTPEEKIEAFMSPVAAMRRLYFSDEDIQNILSGNITEETQKCIDKYNHDNMIIVCKKLKEEILKGNIPMDENTENILSKGSSYEDTIPKRIEGLTEEQTNEFKKSIKFGNKPDMSGSIFDNATIPKKDK